MIWIILQSLSIERLCCGFGKLLLKMCITSKCQKLDKFGVVAPQMQTDKNSQLHPAEASMRASHSSCDKSTYVKSLCCAAAAH